MSFENAILQELKEVKQLLIEIRNLQMKRKSRTSTKRQKIQAVHVDADLSGEEWTLKTRPITKES